MRFFVNVDSETEWKPQYRRRESVENKCQTPTLRGSIRKFIPYYMELLGDGLLIAGMGFWTFIMVIEQMYGSITLFESIAWMRWLEIITFSLLVILGIDRLIDDIVCRHWKD